jgi:hypothetical protein
VGNSKDEVFERCAKCPVSRPLSLHRSTVGEPAEGSFARIFEGGNYIWVPLLDPEAIKILSLGAIWNFSKEQGSTELTDYGARSARL